MRRLTHFAILVHQCYNQVLYGCSVAVETDSDGGSFADYADGIGEEGKQEMCHLAILDAGEISDGGQAYVAAGILERAQEVRRQSIGAH